MSRSPVGVSGTGANRAKEYRDVTPKFSCGKGLWRCLWPWGRNEDFEKLYRNGRRLPRLARRTVAGDPVGVPALAGHRFRLKAGLQRGPAEAGTPAVNHKWNRESD